MAFFSSIDIETIVKKFIPAKQVLVTTYPGLKAFTIHILCNDKYFREDILQRIGDKLSATMLASIFFDFVQIKKWPETEEQKLAEAQAGHIYTDGERFDLSFQDYAYQYDREFYDKYRLLVEGEK